MASSNVPLGADNDVRAPFNENPNRAIKIPCNVQVVMHKTFVVETTDYKNEYDAESGGGFADTSETDFLSAYNDSCVTIQEIFDQLKKYIKHDLSFTLRETAKERYLKKIYDACNGWEVEEINVEEK
jgi:hypothetical protein